MNSMTEQTLDGSNAACGQSQVQAGSEVYRAYGALRAPLRESMIVWVLEKQGFISYLVTDNLSEDQAQYVVARLGPFTWERGQGIDHNLRHLLNRAASDHRQTQQVRQRDADLQARVERAVQEQLSIRDLSRGARAAYEGVSEPNKGPDAAFSGAQTAYSPVDSERVR